MRLSEICLATARSVGAVVLFVSMPLVAHHSYAMFDKSREVSLEGTVRNFQWTNPHMWLDIVVIDKRTGRPTNWSIEGKGPVELVKDGWRRDSVKTGDKVSLVIYPLKKGANGGSLVRILVNGKAISGEGKGR